MKDAVNPSFASSAEVPHHISVLSNEFQRPYEGIVDTYLNRIVGQPLTQLFIRHRISANAITIVAAALGILAAALLAMPYYAMGLIGALIFQLAAVLDCCDGEVARQTGTASEFGAKMDIYCDYLSYAAVFLAIGWRATISEETYEAFFSGIVASIARGLIMWQIQRGKAALFTLSGFHRRVVSAMANRDFSILLLAVAVGDLFGIFIKIAAIVSAMFSLYSLYVEAASRLKQ